MFHTLCVVSFAVLLIILCLTVDASAQCGTGQSGCSTGGRGAQQSQNQGCGIQQRVQRANPADLLTLPPAQTLPPAPKAEANDDDQAGIFRRGRRSRGGSGGGCGKGGCGINADESLFAAPVPRKKDLKPSTVILFASN